MLAENGGADRVDTWRVAAAIPLLRRARERDHRRGEARTSPFARDSTRVEGRLAPSASPRAKLQATEVNAAGRKRYHYHPAYRARQEKAKYDRLISFAEHPPGLRETIARRAWSSKKPSSREGPLRSQLNRPPGVVPGGRRPLCEGVTDIRDHDPPEKPRRRARLPHLLPLPGKALDHAARTASIDAELAAAIRELMALPGARPLPVRARRTARGVTSTSESMNEYVEVASRRRLHREGFPDVGWDVARRDQAGAARSAGDSRAEAKRQIADGDAARRGEKLGNTPAVARSSYVSPAVVEAVFFDGRTIEDFRP